MIKFYYPVTAEAYDIDDKIKFSWNICGKVQKTRYSKIRHEKEGRSYFKSYNLKIYLDRCMRAGN